MDLGSHPLVEVIFISRATRHLRSSASTPRLALPRTKSSRRLSAKPLSTGSQLKPGGRPTDWRSFPPCRDVLLESDFTA